jgi:hypothetical protein
LVAVVENEMKQKLSLNEFDEKMAEMEKLLFDVISVNRCAVWKWDSADIAYKGEVVPSINSGNTLGDACIWDEKSPRFKIQTSGIFHLLIYIKYLTSDRPGFTICIDDEPFYIYNPLDREGEDQPNGPSDITISKFVSLDSAKTISLFYDKRCYSTGSFILREL